MAIAISSALSRLRSSFTPTSIGSACILALALIAAYGAISLAGTKTGVALALLAVAGPIAVYAAIRAPLVFPFCVFVLLVPFDNLLFFSAFGTITKLLAIVSGAAIVFRLLLTRRFVIPDRAILWWALFLSWIVISLLWAIDPTIAFPHLGTIFSLFLLYAAVSFIPIEYRTLKIVLAAICCGGALAGAYGAYLFHQGADVSKDGRLFMGNGSDFIDPNQLAASLVLPFTLSLSGIVTAKRWPVRIAAIAAVVFVVIGLALCGSRGGLLGMAAAFVYLTWRSRHRVLLAFVGLTGFAAVLSSYGNILMRFSSAASSGGAGRTSIWAIGFAAFKASPVIGYGFSNFPLAYDRFFLAVPEHFFTDWDRDPHDLLLQTSVELGLIGLVLLGLTLWNQFRSLRAIGPEHALYSTRIAIEAAYIGLGISAIFLDVLEYKYLWLLFIASALVRNAFIAQGVPARERPVSSVLQPTAY